MNLGMGMSNWKVAVISDIHGNCGALEAVLQDIHRRRVDAIVNLGDSLYGPLDPAGTARLLRQEHIFCIRGNEDRLLINDQGQASDSPSLDYTRTQLSAEDFAWLGSLKPTAVVAEAMFLCHGTPARDDEYLFENVGPEGAYLKSFREISAILVSVKQPLILCGHSHVFRTIDLGAGKRVVNAGSVGLPAYCDHNPFMHCMESGTPHAKYVLLTNGKSGWTAQLVPVAYDWQSAAEMGRKNGRPDWSEWLQSGRAGS